MHEYFVGSYFFLEGTLVTLDSPRTLGLRAYFLMKAFFGVSGESPFCPGVLVKGLGTAFAKPKPEALNSKS